RGPARSTPPLGKELDVKVVGTLVGAIYRTTALRRGREAQKLYGGTKREVHVYGLPPRLLPPIQTPFHNRQDGRMIPQPAPVGNRSLRVKYSFVVRGLLDVRAAIHSSEFRCDT